MQDRRTYEKQMKTAHGPESITQTASALSGLQNVCFNVFRSVGCIKFFAG